MVATDHHPVFKGFVVILCECYFVCLLQKPHQFILLNSRSLSPSASGSCQWKLEYLKSFLSHPQVPVFAAALTETWFREEHTEAQVAVEGYTLIRSDRPSRKGGGCALYLNSALTPSDEISWSDQSSNMVAAYIADVHVVMACVYRPPTAPLGPLLERLQVFIDTYSEGVTVPDIYVLGDFNLPDTDWNSYTSKDI